MKRGLVLIAVGLALLVLFVGVGALPIAAARAAEAESSKPTEEECNSPRSRQVDHSPAHEPKVQLDQPISLVARPIPILSFGTDRGTMGAYITLQASEPIPTGIYSTDFEIDTVEPLRRVGEDGLESTHLGLPTFTPPHIFDHREEVGFYLCVDTSSANHAGTYTGQYRFVGPALISTVALTQTAQLKARTWQFLIALVIALALAAAVLAANIYFVGEKKTPRSRRILAGVLTLLAALFAMFVAWSKNPTWGENFWVALLALLTTAFGAAGFGGTLTAAAEKFFGSDGGGGPK
jgi:hypothetical protein